MSSNALLYACLVFAPIHFIFSAILSKELFSQEQSIVKLVASVLIVWLVPILGSFFIYKLLGLKWFDAPLDNVGGSQTVIGGGMAELNAILDPKHRHVVEAKEKLTIEQNLDGEKHSDKSNGELIEKNKNRASDTKT